MWETLGSPATVEQRLRHRQAVPGVLQLSVLCQGQSAQLHGVQGEEIRRQEEASQQLSYYAQEASLREEAIQQFSYYTQDSHHHEEASSLSSSLRRGQVRASEGSESS